MLWCIFWISVYPHDEHFSNLSAIQLVLPPRRPAWRLKEPAFYMHCWDMAFWGVWLNCYCSYWTSESFLINHQEWLPLLFFSCLHVAEVRRFVLIVAKISCCVWNTPYI
jgi:hypothetical protein